MSAAAAATTTISWQNGKRLSGRLFLWSLTAALAGFLFGFDTVVISGAEQKIQALWRLSAGMHGIAIASALYGMALGSLLGGWPTDRLGRRATLLWIGVLYVLSAVGTALAPNVGLFIAARIVGGLGIGMSTVVAPIYIAEISPPRHRGRLAGMFQFNIVFGIVIAFVSNALLSNIGSDAWRWMLGVAAFPSLLYTALCFALPESPRWLLTRKGDRAGASTRPSRRGSADLHCGGGAQRDGRAGIQDRGERCLGLFAGDRIRAAGGAACGCNLFGTLAQRHPVSRAAIQQLVAAAPPRALRIFAHQSAAGRLFP